ncbi:hypothetical protein [Selenomonas sp. KH1T6]|uniref:hypothetical protein n=1 Tax=Selenomonas sp. KH1T6 TaxID=3158784 RepID=UPI0008A765D6|nr:hypothetical protein SAMN05216583_11263 [Selenomonas ruminantium]
MFPVNTILSFALLFLLLLPCAEAADAYADESVLPLVLERHVERVGPRIDTGGLDICLSHASLNLRSYIRTYSKLYGRLDAHSSEQTLSHHYGMTNYIKKAAQIHEQRLADGVPVDGVFFRERELFIRRADTVAVSFLERNLIHEGGPSLAGDLHSVYGRNIDTESGKYITLPDVFTDAEGLASAIATQLRRDYTAAPFGDNLEAAVFHCLQEGDKLITSHHGGTYTAEGNEGVGTWTLEPRGATFYFNPPGLGPVRAGIYCATILFDEYPELFKEKYRRGPASYAIELMPGLPVRTILTNGKGAAVGIYQTDSGPYLNFGPLHYQDEPAKDIRPVLASLSDGRSFLYVDALMESGTASHHELRVFSFNDEAITRQVTAETSCFAPDSGFLHFPPFSLPPANKSLAP